jgi:hypothetical protein
LSDITSSASTTPFNRLLMAGLKHGKRVLDFRRKPMKPITFRAVAARAAPPTLAKSAVLVGVLMIMPLMTGSGGAMEKKGTTPYVTHFVFRPVNSIEIPGLGSATSLEAGGTGKYKGITGKEPFACNAMPALAGGGGYTAMDIPHNTTWEIK